MLNLTDNIADSVKLIWRWFEGFPPGWNIEKQVLDTDLGPGIGRARFGLVHLLNLHLQ